MNKQLIEEELRNSHLRYVLPSPRVSTPDETDSETNTERVTNGFQNGNGEPSSVMTQSYLSVDSVSILACSISVGLSLSLNLVFLTFYLIYI